MSGGEHAAAELEYEVLRDRESGGAARPTGRHRGRTAPERPSVVVAGERDGSVSRQFDADRYGKVELFGGLGIGEVPVQPARLRSGNDRGEATIAIVFFNDLAQCGVEFTAAVPGWL